MSDLLLQDVDAVVEGLDLIGTTAERRYDLAKISLGEDDLGLIHDANGRLLPHKNRRSKHTVDGVALSNNKW